MKVFYSLFCFAIGIIFMSACSTTENYAPVNEAWSQKSEQKGQHVVQKGETLYAIAWRYDIDYRALAEANHLSPPYTLETGQVISLNVPPAKAKPIIVRQQQQYQPTPVEPEEAGWKVKATPAAYVAPIEKQQNTQPAIQPKSTPVQTAPVVAQASASNQWIWPAKGKIVQGYSPTNGEKGVDIAGTMGEPIYAASSGKVAYAGNGLRGYGNLVIIKHNDEFLSAYAHNQKILVHEGQEIKAGQQIATMGNTESKTVMLHFEIREAGKSVNPLNYVKP